MPGPDRFTPTPDQQKLVHPSTGDGPSPATRRFLLQHIAMLDAWQSKTKALTPARALALSDQYLASVPPCAADILRLKATLAALQDRT
nr:hypothetical protein [uncultured Lichenicoccus sp.]